MSADNWTTCPRCEAKRADDLRAKDVALAEAYGSIDLEDFERLRAERNTFAEQRIDQTFREDYEFYGAEDGVIHASYSGACGTCGLSCQMSHSQTFFPEEQAND